MFTMMVNNRMEVVFKKTSVISQMSQSLKTYKYLNQQMTLK